MTFVGVQNPFGADAFSPTSYDPIRHAPRVNRNRAAGKVRKFLSNPTPPSTLVKQFILS